MGQSGARWEIHELDPTSGPMAGLPAMRSQTEIMRKASTSSCEKDRGGGGGQVCAGSFGCTTKARF